MATQRSVRIPDELNDAAETVARIEGKSINQLIVDSLASEIDRVRADDDFTERAAQLLERDREIIERLGR